MCEQCLKKIVYKVLKSKTKNKTIRLCKQCFLKNSQSLINGHGYYVVSD